jgi:hypothetical protein
VVVCVCSDRDLHQARVEDRRRAIPGWYDPGDWTNVTRRLADFSPWSGDVLVIDTSRPLSENVSAVVGHMQSESE